MILLVEDDPVTAHILTALLKRLRRPHALARTGAEALACLARQPVDLLIVDLGLPDMDGFDLIARVGARPHLQDVPVMVCTADTSPRSVERALALGVVDYVRQPIGVDDFAARVVRALQRAPARWERWPDVLRRLHLDHRAYEQLLALLRDELRALVDRLAAVAARGPAPGATAAGEPDALAATVVGVRGAALNVGAVRVVQLIDLLWTDGAEARELGELREALAIGLGAVEQMMHPAAWGAGAGIGEARGWHDAPPRSRPRVGIPRAARA
jgi:CheY-like chemotaxis protein